MIVQKKPLITTSCSQRLRRCIISEISGNSRIATILLVQQFISLAVDRRFQVSDSNSNNNPAGHQNNSPSTRTEFETDRQLDQYKVQTRKVGLGILQIPTRQAEWEVKDIVLRRKTP